MEAVKLRFPDQDRPDRALAIGMHGVVRGEDGRIELVDGAQGAVRVCVDRRGVWLTVEEGGAGVHVNGRQVRRMAMLRVGDAVYVDGVEMRLLSSRSPEPVPGSLPAAAGLADPRVVLRGVGGRYHGRCFTLEQPRLVGRVAEADIRIDDPAFAERHARLELAGDRVLLRDLGSAEGSMVNGEAVRDALLLSGDQVVFDAHHRFVVEAPRRVPERPDPFAAMPSFDADVDAAPGRGPNGAMRLPWLLLAALAIAGLLALLLLFGASG